MRQRYSAQGLEIMAFPCNQFGRQAPGTARELQSFAEKIGARFRIMAEVNADCPIGGSDKTGFVTQSLDVRGFFTEIRSNHA